jgi:redox-sensitive bicupin YhaK (pirin superfamily)
LEDGGLGILAQGDALTLVAGPEGGECLLLGGPEIDEPIARYGPFVMNTREEIHQAMVDFQNGTLA